MRTSAIPGFSQNTNYRANSGLKKKDVTFGFYMVEEFGGSDRRISKKARIFQDDGKILFEHNGFLKHSPTEFQDDAEFVSKVAKSCDIKGSLIKDINNLENQLEANHLTPEEKTEIKKTLDELNLNLKTWNSLPGKEKKLRGLSLLLPGTIHGNVASYLPNIKKADPQNPGQVVRIENLELTDILKAIDEQGDVPRAKNMKFVPAKDLTASGFAYFEKFLQNPELKARVKDGFFMTVIHSGGGFGSVNVKLKDQLVTIESNEIGHERPFYNILTGEPERLGDLGLSVKQALANFAEKIGIVDEKDIDEVVKTGKGQITTDTQVRINNKNCQKAIDLLLESGIYEQVDKGSQSTLLRVKPEGLESFYKASKYVIDSCANTIAVHAITRITEGVNIIGVSGPFSMGLNRTIQGNPEVYGAKDLKDLISQLIVRNSLDKKGKPDKTIEDNMKIHNFDIICDESVSVKDNTRGGEMMLKGKIQTHPQRGEWMDVPLKTFIDPDITILGEVKKWGQQLYEGAGQKLFKGLKKAAKAVK